MLLTCTKATDAPGCPRGGEGGSLERALIMVARAQLMGAASVGVRVGGRRTTGVPEGHRAWVEYVPKRGAADMMVCPHWCTG